jgi:PEP-CTERM motif
LKNLPTYFLLSTIAGILCAGQVYASPVYYTFNGNVTRVGASFHDEFSVPFNDYSVGQSVTYTFMIDLAGVGYSTSHMQSYDGFHDETTNLSDINSGDGVIWDYFLSEYVGGDAMTADAPSSADQSTSHFGLNENAYGTFYSSITGSNLDPTGIDFISIGANYRDVNTWAVGQTGFGGDNTTYALAYYSGRGITRSVGSSLTLTDISDINPYASSSPASVPEPSSLVFVGVGLFGLVFYRMRQKRIG